MLGWYFLLASTGFASRASFMEFSPSEKKLELDEDGKLSPPRGKLRPIWLSIVWKKASIICRIDARWLPDTFDGVDFTRSTNDILDKTDEAR